MGIDNLTQVCIVGNDRKGEKKERKEQNMKKKYEKSVQKNVKV